MHFPNRPRGGRPKNTADDPLIPVRGDRVRAAIYFRFESIREAALELKAKKLAGVSLSVLQSIAGGNQATCRRSILQGLATLCGFPVTVEWLTGATKAGSIESDLDPTLFLQSAAVSQAVLEAAGLDAALSRGKNLTEIREDGGVSDAELESMAQPALALAGRILNWSAWLRYMSPRNTPELVESSLERVVPELIEEPEIALKNRQIVQAAFTEYLGRAIRILLLHGEVALRPELLAAVNKWAEDNLPLLHSDFSSEAPAPKEYIPSQVAPHAATVAQNPQKAQPSPYTAAKKEAPTKKTGRKRA